MCTFSRSTARTGSKTLFVLSDLAKFAYLSCLSYHKTTNRPREPRTHAHTHAHTHTREATLTNQLIGPRPYTAARTPPHTRTRTRPHTHARGSRTSFAGAAHAAAMRSRDACVTPA
jgi:hypothetical protein